MSYGQLLDSTNTQYREMVQIGTWILKAPVDNGGATFTTKVDRGEEPPGCRSRTCCGKLHFGPCNKPH